MTPAAAFQILSFDNAKRARDYKKRKAHHKSRSGCIACKSKRVKCDESKPNCARCRRNNRSCFYTNGESSSESSSSPGEVLTPLSGVIPVPFDLPNVKNAVPGIHLIKHLLEHFDAIFPFIPNAKAIVTMSQSSSLIRTTVLALAATHLRCMAPSIVQHRISEHFQQALALQQYQAVLYMPRDELTQESAVALLLSAILLNILAFVLPASEVGQCVSGTDDGGTWDLSWLAMQAGLRPLMKHISTYLEPSYAFLEVLFVGSDRPDWGPEAVSKGLERVPKHWRQLFEIEDVAGDLIDCDGEVTAIAQTSPAAHRRRVNDFYRSHGNHYRVPVFILTLLKDVVVKPGHAFKNLQFLIKLQPDFRALLSSRDERALFLYCYWLGLMCRFEGTWWSDQRVQRDYTAISSYLKTLQLPSRAGEEGILWAQMVRELDDILETNVQD